MIDTIADIADLEDTDRSRWTLVTDRLVKILASERKRLDRIDRWNNRPDPAARK